MSDFDEEAERERLREKYESEAEDRKRTQQMSELLLKGATMTNRHCGECGSPVFRYQEQEFCPSCQRTTEGDVATDEPAAGDVDGDDATAGDAEAVGTDATAGGPGSTAGGPGSTAGETTGEVRTDAGTPAANGTAASDGADPGVGAAAHGEAAVTPGRSGENPADRRGGTPERHDARATSGAGDGATSESARATAHDALYAALTRHARLAADTDDPRRATEHLSAAREAAAALDELDGA